MVVRSDSQILNTQQVSKVFEKNILKFPSLIIQQLRRNTKAKDKVVVEMSSSSYNSFVASGASLCIFFEMIINKEDVFKASTVLFQVQKINADNL